MDTIKYLSWDSEFFNKKIGQINCNESDCSGYELDKLISYAEKDNYHLLYVFTKGNHSFLNIKNHTLKLVDEKVIYSRIIDENIVFSFDDVNEYASDEVHADLLSLACQSGEYSRFKIDEQFEKDDFSRLYKTWIEKSVARELADKVLVTKDKHKITGMVTLSYQSDRAIIGLIAVDSFYRGKAYGTQLLHACFDDILQNNINRIDVATQKSNINACSFYEKNGFEVKNVTNVYHLWI
ncbi:MAG: hypothetical protein BGO29_07245 [Bacteroidales bacterium 36-12]|nr:MAG: hypothetical protein BGO29_07245 [Bacteroidales bacterium 36-12]